MLKKIKDSNGLKALQKTISFLDTDIKSRDYFRVHDFPETFFVGKNSFRISGNSELLVNSALIYIDLVDSNGNIIYHEILDVVNSDKSRTVVVYIYPDTPPGELKCYIASRTKFHPLNGIKIPFDSDDPLSDVYKNIPNIMWIGTSIIIPNKQNNSEVYFESDPIVTYSERLAKYDIPQTSSRYTEYKAQSTASVSIQSKTSPFQYSDSRLVKGSTDTENIFQIIPNVTNNFGESSQNLRLPEFSDSNILRSNSDIFTDAMVGGTIVVKNITSTQDIPKDAVSTSSFSIPDYSASILRIINAKTIEVSKPFIFKSTYTSTNTGERDIIFNSFISQTNFTCSYYATTDVSVTQSRRYESFVSMEIAGMEPLIGAVDAISVSYKPVGSFGDFTDVGMFTCREQNILVDTQSLELSSDFGLKETEIGVLRSQANVNSYWTSSKSGVVSESLSYDSTKIANGLYVSYSGSMLSDQYVSVYPKDSFIAGATRNTEYKLEFSAYSVDDNTGWTSPLLDVYISGSNIEQDIIKKTDNQSILKNRLFGEFIGSISSKDGKLSDNTFHFKVISGNSIKPVFVVRSGKWALGKITLSPRKEIGFTPNYYKINIPMTEFKRSSELILNIKYLNSDGVTANVDTKLYGVYFSGSTQIYFDELNGIPSGLISSSNQLPSGVVSSSQQVKDFLPSGTVSSSQQVRDYLPSNLVSSSQQVKDFLPSGVVSSSDQLPPSIVSSSQQVKDFLPTNTVSSSQQVISFLPSGVVSSSNQLPSNIVSSSQQVKDFLPSGVISSSNQFPANIVSSSQQVKDFLPTNTVSSSQQVTTFLPSGVVSSSNQLPSNIVSSSQQVKDFLPSGVVSSSNQFPANIVSSSQQVKDFLPSGTVSSSNQLPSNIVSSSQQVKDFLPSGVISSSNQFPANIVSSSQQVKDFLPVGSVSSSTQIVGGPTRAVQFNWSGSLTGSSDLFYDPVTKLFSVGISEGTYAEQRYQSNFTIRNSSNNNDNYYFTLEKSASNSQSQPIFVIKKDYNNSGSSIGIGVTTPKSSLDVIVRKDNSTTTLQSIAASNSGSGITFTIASSSDVAPASTSYFKLFNVASETTASSNKIGVFANADINGRSYITIGLENSGSQGLTNPDTTWVVIGSGSIYSKEFSGSGYNLNNIDFNKIVNKPSIFSGSGQIDYDGLSNKPIVSNTGSGYLLVNNNHPSQSYGVKNIYHTSSYATASNAIPTAIDQFHLANGSQLIFCTTSSIAGVNHKAYTRELVYEATISFSSAVTTNLRIPIPLYAFNTNFYTGSNYNMGMAYTAETIIFATTGANGSIGAYTWASTAQGRAHVANGGSGRLVMYGQHAVSGGLDVAMGKFGYSPPAYSAYDSRYTVSVVSSSTDLNIQHSLTAPTANSTWDGHLIMKVHQLIYEIYTGS